MFSLSPKIGTAIVKRMRSPRASRSVWLTVIEPVPVARVVGRQARDRKNLEP
jgi:hypothetical protein